jgi:hypothetical protein
MPRDTINDKQSDRTTSLMTKAVISPRVNRPISWALKKTFSTQKTCLDDSGI